jgi:WD40 repeat protein
VIRLVIFFYLNQSMAVQRKLPTKFCECRDRNLAKISKTGFSRLFSCESSTKELNLSRFFDIFFPFFLAVQTTAHSQKVSCLDIGETGRVLVTGGQDRLVNLFAIGSEKPIQVRRSSCAFERWKNEVKRS